MDRERRLKGGGASCENTLGPEPAPAFSEACYLGLLRALT